MVSYLTISTLPVELGFVDIVWHLHPNSNPKLHRCMWISVIFVISVYKQKNKKIGENFEIIIFNNSFQSEGINIWMKLSWVKN
jgi:hypothetical protein